MRIYGIIALLAIIGIVSSYFSGKIIAENQCEQKINEALQHQQEDFKLQVEKVNTESKQVVIKTIKQNEVIKKAVSSYDIAERSRLLAQIQNFEASSRN